MSIPLVAWRALQCRVGRHDTQLYTGDKTHLTKQLARDVSHLVRDGAKSHAGIRFGQVSCSCSTTQRLSMVGSVSGNGANLGKYCLDYRWCWCT